MSLPAWSIGNFRAQRGIDLDRKRRGGTISEHPNLPECVDYRDRGALADLADAKLSALEADCRQWKHVLDDFRATLTTPSALVEWNVLMREELSLVSEAHRRLIDELEQRAAAGPRA